MIVKAPDFCSHNIMNDMKKRFSRFRMSVFVMFILLLKIQLTIHLTFCVIIHTND